MYPTDLRYTKDHQWVRDDGDGSYTIGITDFAQRRLGEIGDIELPQEGQQFEAGDAFCRIAAVKDVSELYLPAAGTIAEINFELRADFELANNDCYGECWLASLRTTNGAPPAGLMPAAEYEASLPTDE
jgi:glycine cleavage system H protein